MSDSLQPHGLQPSRLFYPWDSPGKNTEVGCHFLLQGIFPTQGSNLGLPHCRKTLYRLSHQEDLVMWWKLSVKETQCSGSDKKSIMLEAKTAKTNSAESSHSSVSASRRPLVKVGGPLHFGWKDVQLTKS